MLRLGREYFGEIGCQKFYDQSGKQAYERRGDSVGVDPAYLSNGLIGIRPGRIPIAPAPTCVAGFVYVQPDDRVESLSPAPYPLTTDIRVNGISLLESLERTTLKSQRLDMSNGELTTEFTFDAGQGVVVSIENGAAYENRTHA